MAAWSLPSSFQKVCSKRYFMRNMPQFLELPPNFCNFCDVKIEFGKKLITKLAMSKYTSDCVGIENRMLASELMKWWIGWMSSFESVLVLENGDCGFSNRVSKIYSSHWCLVILMARYFVGFLHVFEWWNRLSGSVDSGESRECLL